MTTTIGSLDLNTFNDLYIDSSQYFWFESNSSATYGAGVHITLSPDTSFIANPSGQNILINTDGISIRNGLLPMMTLDNDSLDFNIIDATNSTYTNVASFGFTTRIGQSADANRVEIGADRMRIISYTNVPALDIAIPADEALVEQQVETVSSYRSQYGYISFSGSYSSTYCTNQITITSATPVSSGAKTITDSNIQNALSILNNGDEFTISIESAVKDSSGDLSTVGGVYAYATFTKGTSATITKTYNYFASDLLTFTVTVQYNASASTFNLTLIGQISSGQPTRRYTAYADIGSIQSAQYTLKNYAYVNGDVMVCSFAGNESQFTSGDFGIMGQNCLIHINSTDGDGDLYYALLDLDWVDDVMVGIRLVRFVSDTNYEPITSLSIPRSGGAYSSIFAITVPLSETKKIIWTSSNVNIATVATEEYDAQNVTITPIATGSCVIKATVSILRKTYTAELALTVT